MLLSAILLISCADSKDFVINGETVIVEPYGWADSQMVKNDSVIYEASTGNIVWSVLLCQTIVAPVIFTGWYLYEPVALKNTEVKSDTSVTVIQ